MKPIEQNAAGPGITDVADVKSAPLPLPEGDGPARGLEQHLADRWTVLGRRHVFRNWVQVLKALFSLVKGTREVEDHLPALSGDNAARGAGREIGGADARGAAAAEVGEPAVANQAGEVVGGVAGPGRGLGEGERLVGLIVDRPLDPQGGRIYVLSNGGSLYGLDLAPPG